MNLSHSHYPMVILILLRLAAKVSIRLFLYESPTSNTMNDDPFQNAFYLSYYSNKPISDTNIFYQKSIDSIHN